MTIEPVPLALQNEFNEALLAIKNAVKRDSYGDFESCSIPTVRTGPRGLGVRIVEVTGWRCGYPRKKVNHLATERLLAASKAIAAFQSAATRAKKNTPEYKACIAEKRRRSEALMAEKCGMTLARYRASTPVQREQRRLHRMHCAILRAHATGRFTLLEILPQIRVIERKKCWHLSAIFALDDLREADPDWLAEAVDSIRSNRDTDGSASKSYRDQELDAREYVHCCMVAHSRHSGTNYDELLASGMDRDLARELNEKT